jgi:imidazolonepropionase
MITLIAILKELLQVRETAIDKVCGAEMAILPTINAFLVINDHHC